MNKSYAICKSTPITISVDKAGQTKLNIGDDSILRDKTITHIMALRQTTGDKTYSKDNNLIVSDDVLRGSKLTLVDADDRIIINKMPLFLFSPTDDDRFFVEIDGGRKFAPSKSYIEFFGLASDQVIDRDYELHFLYED